MTPLEFIKYIVEQLQGTAYEPWVNALLFLLFAVAVLAAAMFLLGKKGRKFVSSAASKTAEQARIQQQYAPEFERFRQRFGPYAELISSCFFAFVGFYSGVVVGVAAALAMYRASGWVLLLAAVWVMASFYYMRINAAAASWSYHEIKNRKS